MIHQISIFNQTPEGEVLPYKRLIGMCRWIGSHFHDSIDYNVVAFSIDLLEWGGPFSDFWSKYKEIQNGKILSKKNQKVVVY